MKIYATVTLALLKYVAAFMAGVNMLVLLSNVTVMSTVHKASFGHIILVNKWTIITVVIGVIIAFTCLKLLDTLNFKTNNE